MRARNDDRKKVGRKRLVAREVETMRGRELDLREKRMRLLQLVPSILSRKLDRFGKTSLSSLSLFPSFLSLSLSLNIFLRGNETEGENWKAGKQAKELQVRE